MLRVSGTFKVPSGVVLPRTGEHCASQPKGIITILARSVSLIAALGKSAFITAGTRAKVTHVVSSPSGTVVFVVQRRMTFETKRRFLLLYASQCGQAKAIAEEIDEAADGKGFVADIYCVSQLGQFNLVKEQAPVVLIASTTGTGELPETARKFAQEINSNLPAHHYSHTKYAVLALGDSNYSCFANGGKIIDKRLQQLGAEHFYATGYADDSVGLELVVEPWIEGLWDALEDVCQKKEEINGDVEKMSDTNDGSKANKLDLKNTDVLAELELLRLEANVPTVAEDSVISSESTEQNRTVAWPKEHCIVPTWVQSEKPLSETALNIPTLPAEYLNVEFQKSIEQVSSQECSSLAPNITVISVPVTKAITLTRKDAVKTALLLELDISVSPSAGIILEFPPELKLCGLEFPLQSPSYRQAVNSRVITAGRYSILSAHILPPEMEVSTLRSVNHRTVILCNPVQVSPQVQYFFNDFCAEFKSKSDRYVENAMWIGAKQLKNVTEFNYLDNPSINPSSVNPSVLQSVNIMQKSKVCITVDLSLFNNVKLQHRLLSQLDVKDPMALFRSRAGAHLPEYIPKRSTLQFILTWCLEIRAVPKKACLRALVEYTSDPCEKRRLQELSSRQGAADYSRYIRDCNICLLNILSVLPSCHPPLSLLIGHATPLVEILTKLEQQYSPEPQEIYRFGKQNQLTDESIKHLPKLQVRSYSAASSSKYYPGKLNFVFNIVEFPSSPEQPIARRGVCTGWLVEQVTPMLQSYESKATVGDCLSNGFPLPQISIFSRQNTDFHLPADTAVPVIMVGPGTGIAPFIGFLQHRQKQREENPDSILGETWLFYGCRHRDRDYLFRNELKHFQNNGTLTQLKVCFSRDLPKDTTEGKPKYVQHLLQLSAQDVTKMLLSENGYFYVCGDGKNMAKDVANTLTEIVSEKLGVDTLEAMKIIASLREEKRYLQDVWN
uniref:methionine synthase reductase n=1 Tax=Pristiophorus japonicus TaxID=55135 RepID=UPI00398F05C3